MAEELNDGGRVAYLEARVGELHNTIGELRAEVIDLDDRRARWAEEHEKRQDELRFVGGRYLADGSGANFRPTRCTGHSSDALAWFAVGMRDEPKQRDYPLDPSDLAACERTYEMAPEFLRDRMKPVLAKYREAVAKDYPEGGPQCAVHPDGEPAVEGGVPTP